VSDAITKGDRAPVRILSAQRGRVEGRRIAKSRFRTPNSRLTWRPNPVGVAQVPICRSIRWLLGRGDARDRSAANFAPRPHSGTRPARSCLGSALFGTIGSGQLGSLQ